MWCILLAWFGSLQINAKFFALITDRYRYDCSLPEQAAPPFRWHKRVTESLIFYCQCFCMVSLATERTCPHFYVAIFILRCCVFFIHILLRQHKAFCIFHLKKILLCIFGRLTLILQMQHVSSPLGDRFAVLKYKCLPVLTRKSPSDPPCE